MHRSVPLLLLLVTGCRPRAPEAAVRVEVSYSFKAGCITVHARDAEDPALEASQRLEVLARGPSTVVLAVFRQENWSHTLELTTTAQEQSCEGPEVARDVHTVTLQQKGDIERFAVTLEAPDTDEDGYIALAGGGTDCDDGDGSIRPGGGEVCDNRDNDCDGSTDQGEGLGTPWYPDRDGDGFGDRAAAPQMSCTRPVAQGITNFAENAMDCMDSNPEVMPRSSATETRCDEVDDDCDGSPDDGFTLKGTACTNVCAGGKYICNASHDGLACDAPAPTAYYPDQDGDGAGDESATPVQVCPGATPPAATVVNKDDCDDQDAHNRRGRAEVCDDRDNTCDSQRDEGGVCAGKGWKVLTDAALTVTRQWKTVALGPGGLPVWMAGDNGVLAVRTSAGQPFKSLDGSCGAYNWRAAWVRPSDGHVFLSGDGGRLAEHDGTTCLNQTTVPTSTNNLMGLQGFTSGGTTQLFTVDHLGRLYAWTPGSAPQEHYNETPPTYQGLHGLSPTQLLAVGDKNGDGAAPHIAGYPGSGGLAAVTAHTLAGVPAGYIGSLRAVWMASTSLAAAVGDGGLVMTWGGGTGWTRVAPPADNTTAPFSSVVVLDPSSLYVTDTGASGAIRRRSTGGWVTATTVDRPLRDLALSAPGDIWAVGDGGRVVHFPE
ncbi:putative metal-binding motif-containing protein [Archangium lansingense]|uniref:Metal-binding motif-containing protein n=1 Tax=Archangium lansingense TaxID=2995310 RepID=A0ABT4A718_9BACT|nr:putative metal-binding motif-containing protein [Archangium lansinium]MCY1077447.1 putative metal-binding motif-containing protein [Archangium lansinium]